MQAPQQPPLACVLVHALPLQRALQNVDAPQTRAVVIVDAHGASGEDVRPMAAIAWVNRAAQTLGIRRGMRLGEARGLCHALHAQAVSPADIDKSVEQIWHTLLEFTPTVQPDSMLPGLFWLDPRNLQHIFASLPLWCGRIHETLRARGWYASVVAGFNRMLCYALACNRRAYCIAPSPAVEMDAAYRTSLLQLEWPPALCEALHALGIDTLGAFVRLPHADVYQRFGAPAALLHRQASAGSDMPLHPHYKPEPLQNETELEPPVFDVESLVYVAGDLLAPLLTKLQGRGLRLRSFALRLRITAKLRQNVCITPASATCDWPTLRALLRLRLTALRLLGPVEGMLLTAHAVPAQAQQCIILSSKARRNLDAAQHALAQVRAAFGEQSTSIARLCDAILPEVAYLWEPARTVTLPRQVTPPAVQPLVRQVWRVPRALPAQPKHEAHAWLGTDYGSISRMAGPYRLQTHWWATQQQRDYFYAETRRGHILWLFHEAQARRWFLQGMLD